MSYFDDNICEMSDEETPGKKVFKGEEVWVNLETGEHREVSVIAQEIKHSQKYFKGWRRVYIHQLFDILLELMGSSSKLQVIDFIIDNLDSNNKLCLTQRQIAQKMREEQRKEGESKLISLATINKTIQQLIEKNVLLKIGSAYVFNPKLINAFGSDRKNRSILIEYHYEKRKQDQQQAVKEQQEQKAEKVSQFIKEMNAN
ncbi:replication/maintenance protein RepL [Helicobacter pylori]|uniref:replication/maintenance protein RepL n=1 Tax=Helicobacter pylori TaxID=210 RepID=UPI001179CA26|nr:replication/maintenance protein RepL [Helicobacter pylori]QEF29071.1 hypothetical protein D2C82_08100 [Helicobacter pylori]QEF29080.1 hypothetical protein D2C82_08170 [Helicobacter pylori]